MKKLFILFVFIPLFGLSQTITHIPNVYTDKNIFHQWDAYLADCNQLVPDTTKQLGVVNVKYKPVIVNGEVSHYILSPIDTVWTNCKCKEYRAGGEYLTLGSGYVDHWIGANNLVY